MNIFLDLFKENIESDRVIISIDIGTTAAKVGLIRADNLGTILILNKEYPRDIESPQERWAQSDPNLWWGTAVKLIKTSLKQTQIEPNSIVSIGMCNTCPSLIPIGSDNEALRSAILYMDQRSVKQAEEVTRKIGPENLAEITGNRIASGAFSLTSMLWIKQKEPEIYHKTLKFVHANGYFSCKLTDEAAIDPTNASFTDVFDIRKVRWSDEIANVVGLDVDKLPRILWPYEKVGVVSARAAKELGLIEGIPVAIGCADSPCSALGSGITKPGQVFETTGTSTVVAVVSDIAKFDIRLLNRCYVAKDLWLWMGAMSTTGASLKWVKDRLCDSEKTLSLETNRSIYEIMDEEASQAKVGAEGLIFLPYLSGERSPVWDPYAKGAFLGISLHHTKSDMIRSVLEGVAFGLRSNLEIIESLGIHSNEIKTAGAAAKSSLWRQIKADVLRKKISVSSVKDSTMIGCAILAGTSSKIYSDVLTVSQGFYDKIEDVKEPNLTNSQKYDEYYRIYRKSYKRLKSLFRQLAQVKLE